MKISLNWIKDFVDVDPGISSQELVKTITLSVCEVEGYEETGIHLKDIFVAEVRDIQPHPNADKLSLVTANFGKAEQQVVCGASNFKIGDKVAFAGEGTTLPGDFTIKKTSIRGIESCGMLCAEDELGISDDHAGLMLLPEDTEIGITLDKIFPDQVDVIMEIDNKSITHRPDLWGHYGFAREVGTIYRLPIKKQSFDINSVTGSGERIINVEVQAGDLVPRFCGLSVDKIKIVPSPLWLQHRLIRVGLRPINNMVDLTNYVMLELGQPMHAFDAEQIAGKNLVVKLADPGTKVMTLYQKEVSLGENDMTICDANGASVVAGVIGGLNSGVTEKTKSIFLEAANWDPVGIRKTSTRIGLRTDACQRFEKSLDPEMSPLSIQRAIEIMHLTNPDLMICGNLIDIVNKEIPPITIEITTEFICKRLGKKIDDQEIKEILSYLGFTVKGEKTLMIDVPSFRRTKDVSIKEDIVEEIGRIHGFNNITPKAPKFPIDKPTYNRQHKFENLAKTVLSKNNYHEVINYPLTCQKTEDVFGLNSEGIMKLLNPVSDHQNQMRTSLLPHFIQTILDNQKITHDFRLFEVGRIYKKNELSQLTEPSVFIAAVSKSAETLGGAFYQLKSDLINLLSRLQIGDIRWKPIPSSGKTPYQHSHISAEIFSNEILIGKVYSLSPEYMDLLGLKEDVCVAEMDLDQLYSMGKKEYLYKDPPKYPAVNFEVSLLVPDTTFFQDIYEVIKAVNLLVDKVEFLDVYYPDEFPGEKSISVRTAFRSPDKTFDSEEVKELQDSVVRALASKGFNLREG